MRWWSRRLWPAHLLLLLALAATLLLGRWQLGSWQAHREAQSRDLTHLAPVPLDDLLGPDAPFDGRTTGRPVEVSGTWIPSATLYIEGREHDGTTGVWVVTPVSVPRTAGTGPASSAIPVVRGWAPTPDDAPPAPSGTTTLVGWLQPGEGTLEADTDPGDDLLPQLRLADVVQHVEEDLYSGYVIETSDGAAKVARTNTGADGLAQADLAALPQSQNFTGLRNLLYALQWFFTAGFAVVVWRRHVRDTLTGGLDGAPDEAPDAAPEPARTLES